MPLIDAEMREAAPEYCKAVHRERARWDAEQSVSDWLDAS